MMYTAYISGKENMTELYFGVLQIWESFIYNGARYMKNSVNSAVNLDTHNQKTFDVRTVVRKV